MKTFRQFLMESVEKCPDCGKNPCICGKEECETGKENEMCGKEEEETITDEKAFREFAEKKFKEVFGDDLDKERMNNTIDGILKDNKDLVDKGEWGELVGKLNQSFAH